MCDYKGHCWIVSNTGSIDENESTKERSRTTFSTWTVTLIACSLLYFDQSIVWNLQRRNHYNSIHYEKKNEPSNGLIYQLGIAVVEVLVTEGFPPAEFRLAPPFNSIVINCSILSQRSSLARVPAPFRITMSDMKVDPTRAKALVSALQSVSERIAKAAGGRNVRFSIHSIFNFM